MDKLTAIKIKYDDGTYSDEIPVSVLSENVEWDSTHTLVDVLGSIDVDVTGTIQDQISQLFNEKVSASAMQDYVTNSMPTYITNWLNTNVNPVGSAVVVDSSLTVSGAAADAKVTGDEITDLKSAFERDSSPVPSAYFSNKIAELYIIGDPTKSYNVRRMILSDGVGSIAIGDTNDWVCYVSTDSQNPFSTGEAIRIPEYRNSGVTAYIVLKSLNALYTGSRSVDSACLDLRHWPIISQYLVGRIEDNTEDIAELQSFVGFPTSKVVFLGDSIFGQERGATSIPLLVGSYTHATTYNCALGGTEGNSHGDNKWKYFDFTELSKAIVSGTYTDQEAHESDQGIPNYFAGVIDTLQSLDFTTIDIICITYGGNDYINEHSDITTFVTAMEENINRILTAYPNVRFLLMTPPYKRNVARTGKDGDEWENTFGKTLRDYAKSYKTISEDIHVPYINAYDDLGINKNNASQWFITNDGSHPSEQGRKETAKLVAEYMKRMLYK